jgi:hypothetical protein
LGDVTSLPIDGDKFSVVLSVFGVMYAQDEQAVVQQLAAHCDRGARIALTAWSPGSFMPEFDIILGTILPSSNGGFCSSDWGDRATLEGLMTNHSIRVCEVDTGALSLDFPDLETATNCFLKAAEDVEREGSPVKSQDQSDVLRHKVTTLIAKRNEGETDRVRLSLEYLLMLGEYAPDSPHQGG